MRRVALPQAKVFVFTFKDGALSALAHDLKLQAMVGHVELDETKASAVIDARSLVVVSPQREGRDAPSLLPQLAYREIEKNTANDVLHAAKHPEIRFETSAVNDGAVEGRLTLHGHTRAIRCARADDAAHLGLTVRLDQRDFGIVPYRAMLGTLKVQPHVEIRVQVPRLS